MTNIFRLASADSRILRSLDPQIRSSSFTQDEVGGKRSHSRQGDANFRRVMAWQTRPRGPWDHNIPPINLKTGNKAGQNRFLCPDVYR